MKLVTYSVGPKGHTDHAMAHEHVNSRAGGVGGH